MAAKNSVYQLGIEITDHAVKLVQRNLTLNEIDLIHIEPLSAAQAESDGYLAQVIKKIAKIYGKSLKTRTLAVSVPAQAAYLRIMTLDSELGGFQEQIEWEMEQQTIGKSGNVVVDWVDISEKRLKLPDTETKLPAFSSEGAADNIDDLEIDDPDAKPKPNDARTEKSGTGKSEGGTRFANNRYLVVAVESQKISKLEQALRKAKFIPVVCDVDVLALLNIFTDGYPEEADEFAVLADLCPQRTALCLTQGGRYLDSDCLTGLTWETADASALSIRRIDAKIKEMAEVYAAEQGELKKLYLSGELMVDVKLRDLLLTSFSTPVEMLNPFKAMGVAPDLKSQVSQVAPALAVVTGLTLRAAQEP